MGAYAADRRPTTHLAVRGTGPPYNSPPVTALPSTGQLPSLARHEGLNLFTAAQALLKGVLEADTTVELIAGPRSEAFAPVLALNWDEAVAALLEAHATTLLETPDAGRAVTLAGHRAVSGRRALALVPNDELDRTAPAIERIRGRSLERGGAVCLVLEDDPVGCPSACPRRTAVALDLPCVQPANVEALRDAVDDVARGVQDDRLATAPVHPQARDAHHGVKRLSLESVDRHGRMRRSPTLRGEKAVAGEDRAVEVAGRQA